MLISCSEPRIKFDQKRSGRRWLTEVIAGATKRCGCSRTRMAQGATYAVRVAVAVPEPLRRCEATGVDKAFGLLHVGLLAYLR